VRGVAHLNDSSQSLLHKAICLKNTIRMSTLRMPRFDRKFGDKPAMTDEDINDIIAFMKTLDDGYESIRK
jgi:hypothetical protein